MLIAALLLAGAAAAVQPDEILADPALEARARAISGEVRCLVCRNESIDDSGADLARDLRILVRERLVAGDTDAQVRAFLVDRYGEFVLLNPPFNWGNAVLWLAGPVLFLAGLGAAWGYLRGRDPGVVPELSPEERARLAELTKP